MFCRVSCSGRNPGIDDATGEIMGAAVDGATKTRAVRHDFQRAAALEPAQCIPKVGVARSPTRTRSAFIVQARRSGHFNPDRSR